MATVSGPPLPAMKIKVCGLTREEDVRLACALGAWAVGFVFAESSPRRVTLERAARLREAVAPGVLSVGVFEDALAAELIATTGACRLDAVQLHGAWPSMLQGLTVPAYRALGLREGAPAPALSPRTGGVLVEPGRAPGDRKAGRKPAPEQQRWAWRQAAAFKREGLTVLVAGGLDAGNVAEAVALARPDGVDVSSGVESAPGVKDPSKLRAFFDAVRDLR